MTGRSAGCRPLCIVSILVWDTPEYVESLLHSMFEAYSAGGMAHEVYVLDQGSQEPTREVLDRYGSHINRIDLERNIGFPGGAQRGVQDSAPRFPFRLLLCGQQ